MLTRGLSPPPEYEGASSEGTIGWTHLSIQKAIIFEYYSSSPVVATHSTGPQRSASGGWAGGTFCDENTSFTTAGMRIRRRGDSVRCQIVGTEPAPTSDSHRHDGRIITSTEGGSPRAICLGLLGSGSLSPTEARLPSTGVGPGLPVVCSRTYNLPK